MKQTRTSNIRMIIACLIFSILGSSYALSRQLSKVEFIAISESNKYLKSKGIDVDDYDIATLRQGDDIFIEFNYFTREDRFTWREGMKGCAAPIGKACLSVRFNIKTMTVVGHGEFNQ